MSLPDVSPLASRLHDELEQEVRVAMATTDTVRELARFNASMRRRRTRGRVIAVAAALCVLAGAGTVALVGSALSKPTAPGLGRRAHQVPTHRLITPVTGSPKALPTAVHVTMLHGPQNLGTLAFSDLWATTGRDGVKVLAHATLYRISLDGSQILSTTSYPKVNDNQPDPVQVGDTILVADRRGGYTVFNPTGQRIGTLPSTSSLGAVAGDSTGGWIATKPNEIARIDSSGLRIGQTFPLPLQNISGLAVSPGAVWVTDETLDQLVRVNPSTGAITGRTQLAFAPTQVRYLDGAVYVATLDDYGLHRIDPSTMALTATAVGTSSYDGYPTVLPSDNGQVWTQALGGTISQLDPLTLRTEHTTRVFPELSDITNGAVIAADRIYVVDGEAHVLYSYPPP